MKGFALEVTTAGIKTLAERRAANGLPPLEAADSVWICSAFVEILAPVAMPNATLDQRASWYADWLVDVEAAIGS